MLSITKGKGCTGQRCRHQSSSPHDAVSVTPAPASSRHLGGIHSVVHRIYRDGAPPRRGRRLSGARRAQTGGRARRDVLRRPVRGQPSLFGRYRANREEPACLPPRWNTLLESESLLSARRRSRRRRLKPGGAAALVLSNPLSPSRSRRDRWLSIVLGSERRP